MDVVVHQAIAVQFEWPWLFQVGHVAEKRDVVSFVKEDRLPDVATIDNVVDQAVGDRSQRTGHAGSGDDRGDRRGLCRD